MSNKEEKDSNVLTVPEGESIVIDNTPTVHYPFLVIDYPGEGRVIVEETNPENPVLGGCDGLKVLVQVFKELQALDNVFVHEILQRHNIRYDEPEKK